MKGGAYRKRHKAEDENRFINCSGYGLGTEEGDGANLSPLSPDVCPD